MIKISSAAGDRYFITYTASTRDGIRLRTTFLYDPKTRRLKLDTTDDADGIRQVADCVRGKIELLKDLL